MEKLIINGVEKNFSNGLPDTVEKLLKQLDIESTTVAAEVDGRIIERDKFTHTKLSNGQKIELVKFMGGG